LFLKARSDSKATGPDSVLASLLQARGLEICAALNEVRIGRTIKLEHIVAV